MDGSASINHAWVKTSLFKALTIDRIVLRPPPSSHPCPARDFLSSRRVAPQKEPSGSRPSPRGRLSRSRFSGAQTGLPCQLAPVGPRLVGWATPSCRFSASFTSTLPLELAAASARRRRRLASRRRRRRMAPGLLPSAPAIRLAWSSASRTKRVRMRSADPTFCLQDGHA